MIPFFQITSLEIGPITLQAWGTMLALAFAVGIYLSSRELKKRGGEPDRIIDVSFWVILFAVIGARFFYVLGNLDLFRENWIGVLKFWEGGAALIGGIAGALVVFLIYIRKKKIPFWELAEPIVFVLPLSIFIGRIGCFLIHDHMGKITNVPWGMEYIDGMVRHETTLYNGLSALLLFCLFLVVKRFNWSQTKGFFTTVFLLWYGVSRFITDFFRADDLPTSDPRWFGFTPTQYVSVVMIGISLYLYKHNKTINLKRNKYEKK
ncbi:prolipoprotein diacylglyceryl transferase [Patescibacteria group bacterium]|nr:prolipoprotein diacylglyceryl transferase [Patescibacteria group bacterium]MBU1075362.1 prolipoprotein diacylglyceryl transferase [Patescibacteria group bacterium]MBU1951894.1 prolipoprotein diacylglyceryl transferase [Patescibacteria group bacterium]MBU2236014.1 prolipoprotein diacylglyceryl transferase [Patescibacteria group bacterium]